MKSLIGIAAIAAVGVALAQVVPTPEPPAPITCGTEHPIDAAELRAVACPKGWVGQWFQERDAGQCNWRPAEPQWHACDPEPMPTECLEGAEPGACIPYEGPVRREEPQA